MYTAGREITAFVGSVRTAGRVVLHIVVIFVPLVNNQYIELKFSFLAFLLAPFVADWLYPFLKTLMGKGFHELKHLA